MQCIMSFVASPWQVTRPTRMHAGACTQDDPYIRIRIGHLRGATRKCNWITSAFLLAFFFGLVFALGLLTRPSPPETVRVYWVVEVVEEDCMAEL